MTIEIRILGPNDHHVLTNVAADVFDESVDPNQAAEFLRDPRHHIAVALDGETVVGMASAVDYVHPDKPVELWINEVGVDDAYHRQGIGRQLMVALFGRGRDLGCKTAWVATEVDNVAARGLYAAVNGQEEISVVYTFDLEPNLNWTTREKSMHATGTFEVNLQSLDAYPQSGDGNSLGRMSIDKVFQGDLRATSQGEMLSARTANEGSAGYVAIERVVGTLDGKAGSFVLQHFGVMHDGENRLVLEVTPGSGTGDLAGLTGTMTIDVADGVHAYTLDYSLD